MLLKKNTFYVFKYNGDGTLNGFDEKGDLVPNRPTEIVMFWNRDDMETTKEFRLATQHEKEYWLESMNIIDAEKFKGEVEAVSLCDFHEWMVKKGYAEGEPEIDMEEAQEFMNNMLGNLDQLQKFMFEFVKTLVAEKGNIVEEIQKASEKYAKEQKHSNHTEKLVCAADFRVGALWLLAEIEKKINNQNIN